MTDPPPISFTTLSLKTSVELVFNFLWKLGSSLFNLLRKSFQQSFRLADIVFFVPRPEYLVLG